MRRLIRRALVLTSLADHLQPLALLALRLYVSSVFFRAGVLKVSDWGATLALFHDEYKVPLLPPDVAACVGAFGELAFPVLITLGLAGRFGAAGLFVVNAMAVISYPQLWGFDCPAAIQMHFVWGAILAALAVFGPGRLSVDDVVLRRLGLAPGGATA
jgi:putative oxidoreductase